MFSEEGIVSDDEGFVHRLALEERSPPQQGRLKWLPAIVVGGPSLSSTTYQTKTSHVYGEGAVQLNPVNMETYGYNTDENLGISREGQSGSGPLMFDPFNMPCGPPRPAIAWDRSRGRGTAARGKPPSLRCGFGTQQAILNEIREWMTDSTPLLWLSGPAGAGKSAIAQTLLQECHYKKGTRLPSRFFSRGTSDRNSDEKFAATISYQLSINILETKPIIEKIVEDDPSIFSRAIKEQFTKLVIDPLMQVSKEADHRTVIILDGLDECDGYDKQRGVLDAIYEATLRSHTLPFRFLVVSRPDPHIRDFFNHDNIRKISRHIPLSITDDVSTYFRTEFGRIRKDRRLPTTWPIEKDIETLVDRASGPFIFASTVLRYIEDSRHYPPARLEAILGITTHNKSPFADLDALYRKILESTSDKKCTLRLFGLLLYVTDKKFASPSFIQHLLGLGPERFETLLHDVHPLIDVPVNLRDENPIQITHTSLMDFLMDRSRSGDYFLDPKVVHSDLTQMCFRVLSPGTVPEGHGAGASFLV